MQQACNDARENLLNAKHKRKLNYDRRTVVVDYKVGDKVLLKNEGGKKMDPLFKGPFVVVAINSPNIVIRIDGKLQEVHKNRVKMYYS